jgi:hypothetical protein
MAVFFYDDGGSNTAPYDTWAKASTTLAAIIAGGLAAGDTIWVGNDTAGEGVGNTTYTLPGTAANPNKIISVQKDASPSVLLAGGKISFTGASTTLNLAGSFYAWGINFVAGTGTNLNVLNLCTAANNFQVYDNCTLNFVGTGNSVLRPGNAATVGRCIIKNSTINFGAVAHRINPSGSFALLDNVTITGSAITGLIGAVASVNGLLIQNCDLSACAQGVVLFPATSTYAQRCIIRNCKLPASWNGTLVTGDAITSITGYRCEMYNCDSADTNYCAIIIDCFGKLVQETILVATGGATDGTTRLSWKIVTTANANQINPFECPELTAWNDTEGTQRTCSVRFLSSALLKDNEAWLAVNYSADTGDPLYQMLSDRTADLIFATPTNQTTDTTSWSDLVTARANNTAVTSGVILCKSANSPGLVFLCSGTGNTDSSEPAGFTGAVDGAVITDGTAQWTARYRQIASVTLPAGKPANKGEVLGVFKVGKASTTVYGDAFMSVV